MTSRLDLNSTLLTVIAESAVAKLQQVQNIAARVVTRMGVRDHITLVPKDLHWLPVHWRIQYKVLLLAYKIQHGLAPNYISELLEPYRPSRPLRSATDRHLLLKPMTRSSWGDRAFSKAAPVLCNALPSSIRTAESLDCFKSSLKIYLFTRAFN